MIVYVCNKLLKTVIIRIAEKETVKFKVTYTIVELIILSP